jgi:NAD-dependent dihydropyrimidine dehydrogenase PreA subunit
MGMFIRVELDQEKVRSRPGLAKKLVDVCPVDIYALGKEENTAVIVEENTDECTLCELCLQAAPDAARVIKLYE